MLRATNDKIAATTAINITLLELPEGLARAHARR